MGDLTCGCRQASSQWETICNRPALRQEPPDQPAPEDDHHYLTKLTRTLSPVITRKLSQPSPNLTMKPEPQPVDLHTEPNGETVTTRYRLRELLDSLDELTAADSKPQRG